MKIAIATRHYASVASHAGQTRDWLLFDCVPGADLPEPTRIQLSKEQLIHNFSDDGAHPLDGAQIVVAASAGDGFFRHMARRGAEVRLTGETDPRVVVHKLLAGEALTEPSFDITTVLCKLHEMLSKR
jgi:hypothetical protein